MGVVFTTNWFYQIFWYCFIIVILAVLVGLDVIFKWWVRVNRKLLAKLIDVFKLVALFVLILSPDTISEYTCDVHPELIKSGLVDPIMNTRDIPLCKYPEGRKEFGLTEKQLDVLDALCNIKRPDEYYSALVIFETFSTLTVLVQSKELLQPKFMIFHEIMFGISSLLWGMMQIYEFWEYYPPYTCKIGTLRITCMFFAAVYAILLTITLIYHFHWSRQRKNAVTPEVKQTEVTPV